MKKAVLLITFNRLDYLQEVFEAIKLAQPPRLYLASDGPRESVEGEKEVVERIRKWLLDNVTWECEVKTRFLDKNSGGCAYGVSGAVTWFFENEEDGIILEDDCVPNQSFFKYCEELLDKYKDDKRVWHIAGSADNSYKSFSNESYYFSPFMHCWGWASWADRWKYFNLDLKDYDKNIIYKIFKSNKIRDYWLNILDFIQEKPSFTWDYQWALIIIENKGLCIVPYINLISNIGLIGEHYIGGYSEGLNIKTQELGEIVHPKVMSFNKDAIKSYEKYINEKFGLYKHWWQKIFSVLNYGKYKIITILGIKIKIIKRKNT